MTQTYTFRVTLNPALGTVPADVRGVVIAAVQKIPGLEIADITTEGKSADFQPSPVGGWPTGPGLTGPGQPNPNQPNQPAQPEHPAPTVQHPATPAVISPHAAPKPLDKTQPKG